MVLDNMFVGDKVHHLGLCTPSAMDQSMYGGTHLFEQLRYKRSVGTCGGEDQFADRQSGPWYLSK